METVRNLEEIGLLEKNKVICDCNVEIEKLAITFRGEGNVMLFYGKGTCFLKDVNIDFTGDNSLCIINTSRYPFMLNLKLAYGNTIYIGENLYTPTKTLIVANEGKNIYINDDCLFARNICIRNSDMHLIYDSSTKERVNFNKSVYIGKHVWIGENVLVLKGTVIGNGSIIGAGSVVSGTKAKYPNCVYAGNPAKAVKKNIFWIRKGTNSITEEEMLEHKYDRNESKAYIYEDEKFDVKCRNIDEKLEGRDVESRIDILIGKKW